jgi:hypothetical protein
MSKHTYDEQTVRNAVQTSMSIAQVLEKLGIVAAGGNYKTIQKFFAHFSIDTSHFIGSKWNAGKTFPNRHVPIERYLSNELPIGSYKLKMKLFEAGLKQPHCESCKLAIWLDEPIPLELDHIDGNSNNNALNNLRILCPNCHAKTSTYRGKNKKS